jgi:hypothetical protein
MKTRNFVSFTTATIAEELKCLAEDLSEDSKNLLIEAADRLELFHEENTDLRLQNHSTKIQAEVRWGMIQQLRDHIQFLEQAGDAIVEEPCEYIFEQWRKAKEAKP